MCGKGGGESGRGASCRGYEVCQDEGVSKQEAVEQLWVTTRAHFWQRR